MLPEIIVYLGFLLVVNLALNIDEKRKKRKSLTIHRKHANLKK